MKNKILYLIFAMALAVCLLVSCGGTGDGGEQGGNGGGGEQSGDQNNGGGATASDGKVIFEMNLHSQNSELSSGVKRYYAGEESKNETIDDMVEARNDAAYSAAGITVTYQYKPDRDDLYKWGANADRIYNQAISGGSSQPDLYCNFAYDMICASIKGAFANLYSTSRDTDGDGKGENHFRFTDADYNPVISEENWFDSSAAEGYFKGYMDSISLSSGKTYCLASDYCTDLVRAFLVIPVNVKLLNTVKLDEAKGIVDTNFSGSYDLVDFYEMVWAGGWDYTMLANISAKVAQASTSNNTGVTKLGDTIGFAAGVSSGLTSSGLLYTTDVEIIDRDNLVYPDENENLNKVAVALAQLFGNNKANGVCIVTADDATANGYNGDLLAIRGEFAKKNLILFGGVITVGALEESDYQNMKTNGGFGVVPVPLYKSASEFGLAEGQLPYKTLVHNLARIVGISCMTPEYEQCTKFLNEVSVNSADILEQYYTKTLADVVSGDAKEYNVAMLNFIRNSVNDCFDKTFDDTVNFYNGNNQNTTTWHNYLMSANYEATSFSAVYGEMAASKSGVLADIVKAWAKLPN